MFISIVHQVDRVITPIIEQLEAVSKLGELVDSDVKRKLDEIIVFHEERFATNAPRYMVEYMVDMAIKAKLFEKECSDKTLEMYAGLGF